MRIALVTREFPPETAWGGIGTFYARFAELLRGAGWEVEVFTQGVRLAGTEVHNGVTVHRVLPRKWVVGPRCGGDLAGMDPRHLGVFALSLATSMLLAVRARHRAQPFDLVEGHEHLGINALINICFRQRPVTVTRYHTAYCTLVGRGLANWPRSRLIRRLESTSLRSAQARISASAFIEKCTRQDFPGTPACDATIPLFPGCQAAALSLPPFQSREKLMVFAGRLMPKHKNPELVAKAFSSLADRFPDWRVEFAGLDIEVDGESTWSHCEHVLARFPGRYRYHGVLDPSRLQDLYRRARIAVMPSGFESFGLVALEAMSNGCVPVVSDNTALPESVDDAGLTVPNGSLEGLVAELEKLMQDPKLQETLSRRCLDRIATCFSDQAILSQNLRVFGHPLNGREARG
jgi:glycosyltransferase involved in cell wall biosynthesis